MVRLSLNFREFGLTNLELFGDENRAKSSAILGIDRQDSLMEFRLMPATRKSNERDPIHQYRWRTAFRRGADRALGPP
jgi:hypothetical protein